MRKESGGAQAHPFTLPRSGESLAQRQRQDEASTRGRLEHAALTLAGERGYGSLSVQAILERTGINRTRFYSLFPNKEACYASAYAALSAWLADKLLGPGKSSGNWVEGLHGGLERLAAFVESEPDLARGSIAEVYVAGGAAMAKRNEHFRRFVHAIDRARAESAPFLPSPPPLTASFVVHAIESATIQALTADRATDFAASIPDFLYLAASFYFGTEQAGVAYRQSKNSAKACAAKRSDLL